MNLQAVAIATAAVLSLAAGSMLLNLAGVPGARAQGLAGRDGRVFELRVYHTAPGRLAALKANFRDTNIAYLKKHGITSIGYWTPQDGPAAENTLIFIVAHDSREAAAKHWKEFLDDPDWQKFAKASQADGKIVESVETTFMTPTDFSALK
jgi:hypothetical protein